MASNEQPDNTPGTNNFSTYASFMTVTKWVSIFVITVLLALYIFLV
ncbi:aa3-type cytochrome c oxidase subunit IV [Sandarakinorhabdus sp.]